MLWIGIGMGAGCGRSMKKRVEADRNMSEELWSRREADRTWLQLVCCALMYPGVLFWKADQTEKETGETEVAAEDIGRHGKSSEAVKDIGSCRKRWNM